MTSYMVTKERNAMNKSNNLHCRASSRRERVEPRPSIERRTLPETFFERSGDDLGEEGLVTKPPSVDPVASLCVDVETRLIRGIGADGKSRTFGAHS